MHIHIYILSFWFFDDIKQLPTKNKKNSKKISYVILSWEPEKKLGGDSINMKMKMMWLPGIKEIAMCHFFFHTQLSQIYIHVNLSCIFFSNAFLYTYLRLFYSFLYFRLLLKYLIKYTNEKWIWNII